MRPRKPKKSGSGCQAGRADGPALRPCQACAPTASSASCARLGRLICDIRRKIDVEGELEEVFAAPMCKAMQIRRQHQQKRGWKFYSWHAPETECIGRGKAHRSYEFGVKVSIATTNRRTKAGRFVLHAKALPGNTYDGHTLTEVIMETEKLTGREIERAYADKGYRGHDVPKPRRPFLSGQKHASSAPSSENSDDAPPSRW